MSTTIENREAEFGDVTIERPAAGQPHKGKVFAAVQPMRTTSHFSVAAQSLNSSQKVIPAISSKRLTMKSVGRQQASVKLS